MDSFAQLAAQHELNDVPAVSPKGEPERYLYSADMLYRYAFGRWWGENDLGRSAVWVMLNPATGDTDGRKRQPSNVRLPDQNNGTPRASSW